MRQISDILKDNKIDCQGVFDGRIPTCSFS